MDDIKAYALQRLERFAIFVCSASIAFTGWMLWEIHKTNIKLSNMLDKHDLAIIELKNTQYVFDAKLLSLESKMITLEMFKRIEQNLGLLAYQNKSNEAMKTISEVLRTEIQAKEKSK